MRRRRSGLVLVLMIAWVALACSTGQRAQVETTLARTLISDEQSNQIGAQVHADVERSGARYVQDPAVRGYVEGVATRIFAVARSDRSGIDYHVHVIDDPKTVNAFAAPGGHLFVSGVDLDVRTKVAGELGWRPVQDLLEAIHDDDRSLREAWPYKYWGLEPLDKRRPDWQIRYASAFQVS